MVTVRPNRHPQPRPATRLTPAERYRLRRLRAGRDGLIRQLLARGVPAWQIIEATR